MTPPNESNANRSKFEAAMRAQYAGNPDQEHSLEELLEWTDSHGYWLDSTSYQFQGWQLALASPSLAEPVAASTVAGALYELMGYLTSRRTQLVLSENDAAGPAVDALVDWAKMRGFSLVNANVENWQSCLARPPALADEAISEWITENMWDASEDSEPVYVVDVEALRQHFKQVSRPPSSCSGIDGEMPCELFHGHAVLQEANRVGSNVPADHVSDVLDAVVRLIRKQASTGAKQS